MKNEAVNKTIKNKKQKFNHLINRKRNEIISIDSYFAE